MQDPSLLPEDAITAAAAAQLLHCHVSTVHRWVMDGAMPGWWRGKGRRLRRLLVSRADVMSKVEPAKPNVGRVRPDPILAAASRKKREREILDRFGLGRYAR